MVTLSDLAVHLGAELHGDGRLEITGVAPLDRAGPGELAFLNNPRFRKHLPGTRAGAVLCRADDAALCPVPALVISDPYLGYARACALIFPEPLPRAGIHPTAVVDASARLHPGVEVGAQCVVGPECVLDQGVVLGPGCILEADCQVGADTRLGPRVTLYRGTRLGRRVRIHAGAVLGADGFGFAPDQARHWVKIPQLGRVVVGDDVEIGANTTIDRGALEDTVIGTGVKMDNLIQVAHNVHIGDHTALAGCVGIAGSTRIGSHCAIGGGAGILGHLDIADGVTVTAMSFVTRSIREPGVYSSGVPHDTAREWNRSLARLRRMGKRDKGAPGQD
ncbi:UDP-3-O-(3-hydroxymyristoyl)glucosamine N-acyltransferase [Thioalkalivibrio sulfidiphilus]|uniref:UDP-3-O-(3-hydroxymyristoyl)glucosamine N-acyltransferase n=1 Tax=Thioalkalivibrio sulfidiphilus TaxID=1033854 RepID=UPI000309764A|nr:UDP-3-O-(3-hydroxymyristoyl)glucosamine N-acyltransferase [Thioalkalivibrio sulfidiphilus]